MGTQALVAFDTDHIKGYVFSTSRLKEIRGASSRLDYLNRYETVQEAKSQGATCIYAHGGSALFLIDAQKAEALGRAVQKLYRERTGGGAAITYAIQPLLDLDAQDTQDVEKIKKVKMPDTLELLRWRLRSEKNSPGIQNRPETEHDAQAEESGSGRLILPSHPFFALCSSCGTFYAEEMLPDPDDPANAQDLYCRSCYEKRFEDRTVKDDIRKMLRSAGEQHFSDKTLWERILRVLSEQGYDFSARPDRPNDFNVFRTFTQGKDYLGLIYADANGMGKKLEKLTTLQQVGDFAHEVDEAVFQAMGHAIAEHLPVQGNLFPFDILLVGGDDIVMVVPATKALQVAHTLADQFQKLTEKAMQKCNLEKFINECTLSVGVVLAPVKYPFYLQQTLAEDVLKAAKKAGSPHMEKPGDQNKQDKPDEQTRINFVVLTGSTSLDYQKMYQELHRKPLPGAIHKDEFYATLRPYTLSQMTGLLRDLREGNGKRLGRTKLHQLREAILKLNRTTTILEALALLRNWRSSERIFIEGLVDQWDTREPQQKRAETLFPWYRESEPAKNDKKTIYRTPLLDFIELYDFVAQEERRTR